MAREGLRLGREIRAGGGARNTAGVRRIVNRSAGRRAIGGRTHSVMKANYGRLRGSGVGKAFASANYMMFRPGEYGHEPRDGHDGVRHHRPHEVHTWLGEHAKDHKFFYRMVMSPGRNLGEEATLHWANRLLREAGHDRYMVFVHAGEKGHTSNPHAHVILLTNDKLTREDFASLRSRGDEFSKVMDAVYFHNPHMSWDKWQQQKQEDDSGAPSVKGMSTKGALEVGEDGRGKSESANGSGSQQRKHFDMDFDM